ncbi:hypothetical protein [Pseudorhodoplanes sp.]|uniref:hypothetical protein n=1 Tax=Pseudorhodoplanes sp. TaxID=1934341 RepID=UPI003D0D25D9
MLLVTPEIDAMLDGHTHLGVFPTIEAEILFGVFSAGHLVRLSRKKTKQKPDLEMLDGYDEVWAMCIRKPRPGWRILGRWFDEIEGQRVFVALRAWDKNKLFATYPTAAQEVTDDWDELFGGISPKRATELGEYVGGVYNDLDKPT